MKETTVDTAGEDDRIYHHPGAASMTPRDTIRDYLRDLVGTVVYDEHPAGLERFAEHIGFVLESKERDIESANRLRVSQVKGWRDRYFDIVKDRDTQSRQYSAAHREVERLRGVVRQHHAQALATAEQLGRESGRRADQEEAAEQAGPRSLKVSWHPDAIQRAFDHAQQVLNDTAPDEAVELPLTGMDLACLVDVGRAFAPELVIEPPTPSELPATPSLGAEVETPSALRPVQSFFPRDEDQFSPLTEVVEQAPADTPAQEA